MHHRIRWAAALPMSAIIALLALPAAAQTPPTNVPAPSVESPYTPVTEEYQIRPGDVLSISVWGHEDLSVPSVVVRPDGKISYPTIGDIYVVGQNPAQLGRIITLGVRKYLNNPNVSVTLISSATEKYFVTGSVAAPGAFVLTSGTGVREAVVASGDLAPDANDQAATLIRDGQRIPVDLAAAMRGESAKNLRLRPGDTLSIDRALVNFQGDFNSTGQQALRRGATLTQAIASAGGPRETADIERIQIIRGNETLYANLREIAVDHNKDITLRPGDVIKADAADERTVPVFISGAVNRQGAFRFLPGRRDTLENAINWAGGATSDADLKHVRLRRTDPDGNSTETTYDLRSIEGRSIRIQANDYIEVNRKKRKDNITGTVSTSVGLLLGIIGIARQF